MRRRAAIFTVIVGLLLAAGVLSVAISRVQEASRRQRCVNNLHQVALGLHNYHDANLKFPAATMVTPALAPARRLSWCVEIDPFVHARMDPNWAMHRDRPWDSEPNRYIASSRMPWYWCPANPEVERDAFFLTHFVGVAGVGNGAASLSEDDPKAGAFGYDRQVCQADFKDGLEKTLMIIETRLENGPWVAGGYPTTRAVTDSVGQFGGMHRGVITACFADGAVKFIRSSVDLQTLNALATIAGGEQTGDFEGR